MKAATGVLARAGSAASLALLVAGFTTFPGTATAEAATAVPASLVAFGDSVPSGSGCDCTFVQAYADLVTGATGLSPKVRNEARGGNTSDYVLSQLSMASVQPPVRSATTVLVMAGANDFGPAFRAVGNGASAKKQYRPVAARLQSNVIAIAKKIRALHRSPVNIVVLDYWNVKKDGAAARKTYSKAQRSAAAEATRYANHALRAAANATGAIYVSTVPAFKGPNGTDDPTALLAADGDHPNAAGHSAIAKAIQAALPRP